MRIALAIILALVATIPARGATYLLLSQTNAFAAGITNEAKAYTDAHAGGAAIPGTLITNGAAISAGDIVAYGSLLTNTAKATFANITNALGYFPLTNTFTGITNSLGYFPLTNTFAAVTNALGYFPLTNTLVAITNALGYQPLTNTYAAITNLLGGAPSLQRQPAFNLASTNIDLSLTNRVFSKSLSTNTTFTFSNASSGDRWTVILTNEASWTATWPTVNWNGPDPVMGVGAGIVNIFSFLQSDGNIFGAFWSAENTILQTLGTNSIVGTGPIIFKSVTDAKADAGSITNGSLTVNTSRLLGRTTASAGAIEEISVGANLTLSGGTLSASAGATFDMDLMGTSTNAVLSTFWTNAVSSNTTVFVDATIVGAGPTNALAGQLHALFHRGTNTTTKIGTNNVTMLTNDVAATSYLELDSNDIKLYGKGTTNENWNWRAKGFVTTITNGVSLDLTAPTLSTATIASDGTTWTFAFDEAVTIGAGGNGGWAVSMSGGGAVTLTYSSGSGTSSLVYSGNPIIAGGETVASGLDYTQPGNGIEDLVGNDLANISGHAVINNSSAVTCASSDTALPHDELLEGFQTATTGYENTWGETGTTANISEAYDTTALSTGKPAGACNQGYHIVVPSDGTETYSQWDRGSAIDVDTQSVDSIFYIYITSNPAASSALTIFDLGNSTDPTASICARIVLYNSAGTMQVRAQNSDGTSVSSFDNLTANSWNKIKLHLATTTTGTASWLTVNDANQTSFDRSANDIRYLSIGSPMGLEAGEQCTFNLDLICVNTP